MGTDIHQNNFLYRKKPNSYLTMEGEDEFGRYDDYAVIKELIPYRSYSIFGIVAGVRGDRFCMDEGHRDYPEEVSEDMKKLLFDYRHSQIWFYPSELKRGLEKAIKEIEKEREDADEEDDYNDIEEDEAELLINLCNDIIERLDKSEKKCPEEIDFQNCKILFTFDS